MFSKIFTVSLLIGLALSTCIYDQNKYDPYTANDEMEAPNPGTNKECWLNRILYQAGEKCAGNYRWYIDQNVERIMYGEPPCVVGYYCQRNNLPAGSGYGGWCVKETISIG